MKKFAPALGFGFISPSAFVTHEVEFYAAKC